MTIHQLKTGVLNIAYHDTGPKDGPVVILLHGWPDDIHGWKDVVPSLTHAGYRTIVPYLRGFGKTMFLSSGTPRDASGVALAQDVIDLADGLQIARFSVVGHDWGGRAAYTLAALFPQRLYAIAALALSYQPRGEFTIPPFEQARLFWYQWMMMIDAGAAAVQEDPLGFARIQWDTWSPDGWYKEAAFRQTAPSFQNPDWVAITLNGYRRRFMPAVSDDRYAALRHKLNQIELISIPTLMIQGMADSCDLPESSEGYEAYFTGGYTRMEISGAGHFPMRERPREVSRLLEAHLRQFAE